jgi:hypothetical protein
MNINPFSCSISDGMQPVYPSQSPSKDSGQDFPLAAIAILGTFAYFGAFIVYGRMTSSAEKLPWFSIAWEGNFDANRTGQGKKISPLGGVWSGTFVNGKLNGKGEIDDSFCGTVTKGKFVNDFLVDGIRIYKSEDRQEYV